MEKQFILLYIFDLKYFNYDIPRFPKSFLHQSKRAYTYVPVHLFVRANDRMDFMHALEPSESLSACGYCQN